MDMSLFSFGRRKETKNYRGIKRTGPGVLTLARQVIYDHLVSIADDDFGDIDEEQINVHLDQCLAQLASWPEAMAITYLLRDLDPEDFYHA